MNKAYLTPAAIVVGAIVIAVAVYAGLKERRSGAEPAASVPPSTGVQPAASATVPAAANTPATPASTGASRATIKKLQAEIEAALTAAKRDVFVPKCWKPAIAKTSEPAKSTYSFEITISPQGSEIGRGISELRDHDSRADVAECLRRQPIGLKGSPPGAAVTLTFTVSFP